MNEKEFIAGIDRRFPYEDESAAIALVDEASRISPNACFMIGEELSRPPRSAAPGVDSRLRVLAHLRKAFDHPLRNHVLDVVELRVRGGGLSVSDAVATLGEVGAFPGQYCAMNIVYFACDADGSAELEDEYDQILQRWMSNREDPLQVSGDIVNTPRSEK